MFKPGVHFYIKCIGKLPGLTNEFGQSMMFETDQFEQPKSHLESYVCMLEDWVNGYALVKAYRIFPEFGILRLTFPRKSASEY